jgi:hypothetical protein
MAVAFYMDEHIPRAITLGLRLRQVDVLTAQEDRSAGLPDPALLDRATALGRVLVTCDDDFLDEAARRQSQGIAFAGIAYSHPQRLSVGAWLQNLELVAKASQPEDLLNRVEFLPL